jgi:uncharacterized membrane protein
MDHAHSILTKFWHQVRARPRLATAVVVGAFAFFALPTSLAVATRALAMWDIGGGLYLVLAWILMGRASVAHMRWRARLQDAGAAAVLTLTIVAAVASLAAIVLELSGLKAISPARQGLHVALSVLTFAVSWLLVHTTFALHYAHVYYVSGGGEGGRPLEFPQQDVPVYMDFLYFAMIVGMTSQTADVAIASTRMRRIAMAHGMISFVFNTSLLALTINIAAGLLG